MCQIVHNDQAVILHAADCGAHFGQQFGYKSTLRPAESSWRAYFASEKVKILESLAAADQQNHNIDIRLSMHNVAIAQPRGVSFEVPI